MLFLREYVCVLTLSQAALSPFPPPSPSPSPATLGSDPYKAKTISQLGPIGPRA
jgi:hypothetical protein